MNRVPGTARLILFCILVSAAATLWGYSYGTGNLVEQLPIVMRAVDKSYLVNDFFVNASAAFSPRANFALLVAVLARLLPLPGVYFLLTFLGNCAIALVSAFFARDLFDGSDLAALFSSGIVLSAKTFWLGSTNTIYSTFLEPSLLAMPLALGAVWMGLRSHPIRSALLAGCAALLHPLLGLETGALMLGVIGIKEVGGFYKERQFNKGRLVTLMAGILILGIFAAWVLAPYLSTQHITSEQFIYLVAQLRHPHHYLPSTFGWVQYLQAGLFIFPAALAWAGCCQQFKGARLTSTPLLLTSAALLLLCLGGYFFVEVIPLRIWTTAQVFRLLDLAKWLGLVFIGGWSSSFFMGVRTRNRYEAGGVLLLSLISPPTLSLAAVAAVLRQRIILMSDLHQPVRIEPANSFAGLEGQNLLKQVGVPLQNRLSAGLDSYRRRFQPGLAVILRRPVFWLVILLGFLPILYFYRPDIRVLFLLPLFLAMALLLWFYPHRWLASAVNSGVILLVIGGILYGETILPAFIASNIEKPVFTLDQITSDGLDVETYARDHTPPDAIFLTPPKMGDFRFMAKRAIVVDFKSFPFTDRDMMSWYERLVDCCTQPEVQGWDAETELMQHYRKISDDQVRIIRQKYNADYAVLFLETSSHMPVIYRGKMFKIVKIK